MPIKIIPQSLSGKITLPPSKSHMHRILIADFLSGFNIDSTQNYEFCDDTLATYRCLSVISKHDKSKTKNAILDCNESASTFRFLLPLATSLLGDVTFVLRNSLANRPVTQYLKQLENFNIKYEVSKSEDTLIVKTRGFLSSGTYELSADNSSQLLTGLLFTLPLLEAGSELRLKEPPVSSPYVMLTLEILKNYGIHIEASDDLTNFRIRAQQVFSAPASKKIEADFSSAAYFLAADRLQSAGKSVDFRKISFRNLPSNSKQADSNILELLDIIPQVFTSQVNQREEALRNRLCLAQCPDLLPVLAVYAANYKLNVQTGTLQNPPAIIFTDIARLKSKESDRIATTAALINSTGGFAVAASNSLTVFANIAKNTRSQTEHTNNSDFYTVDSMGDHRIAMAAAVASVCSNRPIILHNHDCVSKSFPNFWDVFEYLGGKLHEI